MGTRHYNIFIKCLIKDHPHAYGDKKPVQAELRLYQGSSPRVWGQEIYDKLTEMRARIIPTRMGTSRMLLLCPHRAQDHPHAYGDKYSCRSHLAFNQGSSPRVWGQGHRFMRVAFGSGIIPTRMGTSPSERPIPVCL